MFMDLERLEISEQDQDRIDSVFLDAAIGAVNANGRFRVLSTIVNELERIHGRTLDRAHDNIIREESLDEVIVQNLGKLSFLDVHWIPTSDRVKKDAPSAATVQIDRFEPKLRRLFADKRHAR
jgi:hypothetical protein